MLRVRFPLYAKILAWFFLNLVVVATVFALLFDVQFHFNMDWLFATGAKDRLEAIRDLIIGELETTPPDDWGQALQRYSAAHHMQFGLFDEDANPLVGEIATLPAEVRDRILRPGFPPPGRRPGDGSPPPRPPPPTPGLATPSESTSGTPGEPPRRRWGRF